MELSDILIPSKGHPQYLNEDIAEDGGNRLSESDENAVFCEKDLRFFNEHMDDETADFLRLLVLEGQKRPGDSGVSLDSKPSWVDDEKLRLGQQFAMEYFFGVNFADVVGLFLLFTVPDFLQPFIFTGNSDTPAKAFRRYLSTLRRVHTWYRDDLWAAGSKARRNLRAVRGMHDKLRRNFRDASADELARRTRLEIPPWAEGAAHALRKDFACERAAFAESFCPLSRAISSRGQRFNQFEMSITQFLFVSLQVTFPEHVGTGGASEQQLDAFVHLWEVIGYLLGVEERFNFCAGGLGAVRKRTKAVLKVLIRPSLAHVDVTWEHMTRSLFSGLLFYSSGVSYEVALVHVLEAVGATPPRRLLRELGGRQRLQRRLLAWVLRWTPRVPPLRAHFNRSLLANIERANARVDDGDWLRANDERVGYASYQKRLLHSNKRSYLPLVTAVFTFAVITIAITIADVYYREPTNNI